MLPITAAVLSSTCCAVCAMAPMLIIATKANAKIFFIFIFSFLLKFYVISSKISYSIIKP
ncbi:Uncharacterised protein [Segatella copri]|nr:Uncharacterised protein [Segatella copri]